MRIKYDQTVLTILLLILSFFATSTAVFSAELENITIGGEISNGLSRVGHETVEAVTKPFTLDNGNIFITAAVAGAVGATYLFDKDIHDKLQSKKSKSMDKITDIGATVGNPYIHIALAATVYGGAIAADSAKWKQVGEMMGEALILTDASTFIIKSAAGRGRPNVTASKDNFKPFQFKTDYDSFPSMHTASSFAMASVLASTSDSYLVKTAYYTAATFVGFSRMYQSKHWASDVVLAAAIGEFCGTIVTNYHISNSKLGFVPQVYENGAGLAMVGRW